MADDKAYDQLGDDPAEIALGDVRALIPDIEQLENPIDPAEAKSYLFSDVTLTRYLRMNRGSVKRAAADACEALGGSELLIMKKITTNDLMTDGPAVAKEYGAKANRLRAQADKDDDMDDSPYGIVVTSPFLKHPVPFDGERAARGGPINIWG